MIEITQEQIMQNWNGEIPLVSISCITYNHEPYIVQALNGFLMQKTSFPFEVLVHDDASTDRTADIIREYEKKFPKIIKPIYQKENQYSKGFTAVTATWNVPRAQGKYIALCEGDDYWIDENKLQMQVDFLEKNPEYGMCYTKSKQFLQEKGRYGKKTFGKKINSYDDIFVNGNRIPTPSVVCRKELMSEFSEKFSSQSKKWIMGDLPLWLFIFKNSNVKFLNQETCVYRVLKESASHSVSIEKQKRFRQGSFEIRNYFAEIYNNKDLLTKFELNENFNYAWRTKNHRDLIYVYKKISVKNKSFKMYVKFLISTIILIFYRGESK